MKFRVKAALLFVGAILYISIITAIFGGSVDAKIFCAIGGAITGVIFLRISGDE